jgi:hypothetical protein
MIRSANAIDVCEGGTPVPGEVVQSGLPLCGG